MYTDKCNTGAKIQQKQIKKSNKIIFKAKPKRKTVIAIEQKICRILKN